MTRSKELLAGLDEKEAASRLEKVGENRLKAKKRRSAVAIFFSQFSDAMIWILLAATGLSFLLGDAPEAITILLLVLLNALLGFLQENKTEKTIEKLKELGAPKAQVIREGKVKEISPALLVPGDLVCLSAGDRVPADGVLQEAAGLLADESLLTGESRAEEKRACRTKEMPENQVGCKERVYMGSVITAGHGKFYVSDTGMNTQMGRIAHLLDQVEEEKTPLQKRLAKLGQMLGILCLAVCSLVALLGFFRGEDPLQMLITGISLAVAAVPEGLPAVVTLSLALATGRMLRQNALLRRLHLVETLGSTTVICSDKTGTLTQNRMELQHLVTPEGKKLPLNVQGQGHILYKALAGSDRYREGEEKHTDATEEALHLASLGFFPEKIGKRLTENPFDSTRKRMSLLLSEGRTKTLFAKGATEFLLPCCKFVLLDGKVLPLDEKGKKELLQRSSSLASEGLRVISFAIKEEAADGMERELIFVGFAALEDPPRPGTKQAIADCRRAGIRTVMITGDAKETAVAIGKKIGLVKKGRVLSGPELDRMDDRTLQTAVTDCEIFARVTPEHKLRIVRALKKRRETVAMTGDGVNDAPAVKEADIGIAMGKSGTDVTREAAGMTLLDDRFETIALAVKEGRAIYDNIRRFIRYLLSCNLGEVLCMLLGMLFSMPALLLPIQILFVNFVTDGLPALALGLEPPEKGIMERPPRKSGNSVFSDGLLFRILLRGVLIALATVFTFQLLYYQTFSEEIARTGTLVTLILTQLLHALECKSEQRSLFSVPLFSNPKLLLALGFSLLALLAALYLPFLAKVFSLVPLTFLQFFTCVSVALTVPFLGAIGEYFRERREKRRANKE
ncbi:MAG: cation-translocating P-type ATPase [Oscillospiraceae bacterium]|nr:cation-translocating P-type ATPase [Oscillospiraceae bacterium]